MVKNYFYNLLLTLTNLLFPILSFPYVSRVLGPEGIGQVQFVFSFAQYFSIIASLGVPIYGLKEIAKHKGNVDGRSQVFSELMTIYSASCGCLFLLYLITINLFPYFAHDLRLYLAAGLIILLGFTNIEWLYSGMEEFRSIAVRSVAFKILGLLLLYLFIRSRNDFDLYLYLLMFSYLGNNVLSLFLLKGKIHFRMVKAGLTRHFRPLGYILGTTLAASMYTDMDTVLLGFLSDKRTVGLYTAAVKLSKIAIPFVTSMNVILLPKIGKAFADGDDLEVRSILTKAFNFVVFFSIPIVCGLALLAPEFIRLFSGSEFLPATNSMRLLALLPLIIGFAHYFLFMILVPSDHNKEMFTCVMGGVITSVLLNFLLVPTYKEVGSAIANISAEVVVTALYFCFIKRFYVLGQRWMLVVEAVICCLVFIPVVWLIRVMDVPLILTVIFGVVSCAISYFFMQLLFRNTMVAETIAFIRSKINFAS